MKLGGGIILLRGASAPFEVGIRGACVVDTAQSVIIAKRGQISDVMKCGSGYSRITKFTISKRLAHMVAPWMRTGVWKLGLLTVLVIERVKVARLHDSELWSERFA